MFDVFGKMESADAINKTAKGLVAEKDLDNLKVLARENGLDEEMAEYMAAGETDFLCSDLDAALGRIQVQLKDYKDNFYKGLACEIYETMEGYISRERIKLTVTDPNFPVKIDTTGTDLSKAIMRSDDTVADIVGRIVEIVKKKQAKGGWVPPVTLCAIAMDMYLKGGKA